MVSARRIGLIPLIIAEEGSQRGFTQLPITTHTIDVNRATTSRTRHRIGDLAGLLHLIRHNQAHGAAK